MIRLGLTGGWGEEREQCGGLLAAKLVVERGPWLCVLDGHDGLEVLHRWLGAPLGLAVATSWGSAPVAHDVSPSRLIDSQLEKAELRDGKFVPRAFAGCPTRLDATPLERDLFRDPPETGDPIIEASHIHRANQNRAEPTTAAAHRIFRQGYEYLDEIGADGPRLGLNFISFQRDLEHLRQVLGLSSWLGAVNFGGRPTPAAGPPPIRLIDLLAGGLYVVPPRASPFPGAGLLETYRPHGDAARRKSSTDDPCIRRGR